jgi:hemoglobin
MSQTESLYEQLGGASVLGAAVQSFHERLCNDPELAHFFEPERSAYLLERQLAYFTSLLGGNPGQEPAIDLAAAHAEVAIEDRHVEIALVHLRAALTEAGADPAVTDRVVAVAARLWWARRW